MREPPRRLLSNPDGEVVLDGLRLRCACEGGTFERAFRHLAALGAAVAAIVTGLFLAGAVPPLLLSVFAVWLAGAAGAVLFIRRRGPQHGRFDIDFERGVVEHVRARGAGPASYALAGEARLEPGLDATDDESLPRWLVFELDDRRPGAPRVLRLARAPLASLHPVLYHFRRHGLASAFPARAR